MAARQDLPLAGTVRLAIPLSPRCFTTASLEGSVALVSDLKDCPCLNKCATSLERDRDRDYDLPACPRVTYTCTVELNFGRAWHSGGELLSAIRYWHRHGMALRACCRILGRVHNGPNYDSAMHSMIALMQENGMRDSVMVTPEFMPTWHTLVITMPRRRATQATPCINTHACTYSKRPFFFSPK